MTEVTWFNILSKWPQYLKNKVPVSFPQFEDNNGSSSEDEDAEEEEDVDAALKKEVAQLQASGSKQERRFNALESGANNVIFIKTHNLGTFCLCCKYRQSGCSKRHHCLFCCCPESDKLVHHILSDLHATKKKKSRVILRMLPVRDFYLEFLNELSLISLLSFYCRGCLEMILCLLKH